MLLSVKNKQFRLRDNSYGTEIYLSDKGMQFDYIGYIKWDFDGWFYDFIGDKGTGRIAGSVARINAAYLAITHSKYCCSNS